MARQRKQGQDENRQEPFLLMRQTEKDIVWEIEARGDINSRCVRIYYALASHTDLEGKCWPVSVTTLAREINVKSPETVRKGLRELENVTWSRREHTAKLLVTTRTHYEGLTQNGYFLPARAYANMVYQAWLAR